MNGLSVKSAPVPNELGAKPSKRKEAEYKTDEQDREVVVRGHGNRSACDDY
jgi:hypothetical protein